MAHTLTRTRLIPRFTIHIIDTSDSDSPLAPSQPTRERREVHWTTDADNADSAIELGYRRWDQKYPQRPVAPQVTLQRLDA